VDCTKNIASIVLLYWRWYCQQLAKNYYYHDI